MTGVWVTMFVLAAVLGAIGKVGEMADDYALWPAALYVLAIVLAGCGAMILAAVYL